ncbi:MAG: Fic family protein [Proteobacteria bacterium]|nr:Fic family protein [Pseudomonadota bacterium]
MSFSANKPYNDLPKLPPAKEVETKAVLKQCIASRAALAELKQAGELIPNASMLVNTLPLLEAQASSEIENIVTTTDQLFQYASIGENRADPATKEALRYRTALYEGVLQLSARPVCTRLAEQLCTRIKHIEMRVRKVPGTTLANSLNNEIIYTPPEGEALLRQLLANWETYIHNETDTDPLVRMAVSHYQFEAIHPFTDGNGRTGRIVNILFLIEQQLLTLPILYLSRYIINKKSDYYRYLLDVTRNHNWENWIIFILKGVEETAIWTREKIDAIRKLLNHTSNYVQKQLPGIYSRELVELIFSQPYCRIANLVDSGLAKRQTASVYLKQLAEKSILKEIKVGREKLFIHPKLMSLLRQEDNNFTEYH